MIDRYIVGKLDKAVIDSLGLDALPDSPIFIAESNILHIRERHSDAYMKYFDCLADIIREPDYIGVAGVHAPSVEYVKRFLVNDELVNVAVRATRAGVYYVRSMFVIEEGRLNDYLRRNMLIDLTK